MDASSDDDGYQWARNIMRERRAAAAEEALAIAKAEEDAAGYTLGTAHFGAGERRRSLIRAALAKAGASP